MNKENDWQRLTGPVPYKLTNDYLFRALLQENEEARKSIIAAVLELRYEDIIKAEVTNPIELGKTIDSKTFFLDVKVEINNSSLVNLEMQVINEYNWPERSLGYLCRTYDNLNKGSDYLESKPAYQVSFLDFDLFENNKSLLSVYKLSNQKNPKEIYTDNFTISVVNLRRIENATEEDISSGLRDWASLFKAESWEEIKMIAAKNNIIESAVSSIHVMTKDEIFREQCELREARTRAEEIKKQRMEAMEKELEELREAKENAAKIEQQRMEAMEKEIEELREAKEKNAQIEQERKKAMEKEIEELREAKEKAAKIEQQRKEAMEKEMANLKEEIKDMQEEKTKMEQTIAQLKKQLEK